MIHALKRADWAQIKAIYVEGIETKQATFEQAENVTTYDNWVKNKFPDSCIGVKSSDKILGWAALSRVSSRSVYAGVAETSVYVSKAHIGKGIGSQLMEMLVSFAEHQGIWTLQASIFPENPASISLHQKYGFRQVGYREMIGKQNGVWRNTVLLERRSKSIV